MNQLWGAFPVPAYDGVNNPLCRRDQGISHRGVEFNAGLTLRPKKKGPLLVGGPSFTGMFDSLMTFPSPFPEPSAVVNRLRGNPAVSWAEIGQQRGRGERFPLSWRVPRFGVFYRK